MRRRGSVAPGEPLSHDQEFRRMDDLESEVTTLFSTGRLSQTASERPEADHLVPAKVVYSKG